MPEIRLVKKYPHIKDEDVTSIFQEGYIKGFENGRKGAILIDKPFLKMRYGDYVVYNKKWLVNHLQTEWNILQGKEYQPAIPIEWIKNYARHKASKGFTEIDCYWQSWEEDVLKMVAEWEKENEKID